MRVRTFLGAWLLATTAASAQPFDVTMNPAASTASWTFQLAAPFQTSPSGTCNILGNYDATTNPGGTRTVPGWIGGNTSGNTPVPITSGSISANAGSGANPLHPASTFGIYLEPDDGLCTVTDFFADILNGQSTSSTANLSISFGSFRTYVPFCLVPGAPLNVPLGTVTVTGLTALQDTPSADGTLTPAGGGAFNFTVPMTAMVQITATLDGEAFPVDPVQIAFALTGTITPHGDGTATVSASISINEQDSQPGAPLDPMPMAEPICGGNLLVTIVLASVDTTTTINANLAGTGVSPPPACDADVNCDGAVNGVDVEVQELAVGGDLADYCLPDADFNQDGAVNGGDVEAVELVVGGAPCP
ncbi:MAG: hypothetical protein HBSAPP03_10590 [Phycisphaerae bacterium]|nr:MAG: hypothetical protein HBSAPP03_10590 [Phycisphaerae bacterium]